MRILLACLALLLASIPGHAEMVVNSVDYTLGDNRTVAISFDDLGDKTHITETFEAETENSVELQRQGWQAILDSFRRYVEKQ